MEKNKLYRIIALIGEAGSGKDRLMKCLRSLHPEYNEIISCTTRPKRMGEVEGENYYFLTPEKFVEAVNNNDMLEHTEFNNWFYGTPKWALKKDKINVGVFNPAGIRSLLRQDDIDLRVYYVRAQPKTRLIRQLSREDDPNVSEVIRRYHADEIDFTRLPFVYDVVNNETIDDIVPAVYKMQWA